MAASLRFVRDSDGMMLGSRSRVVKRVAVVSTAGGACEGTVKGRIEATFSEAKACCLSELRERWEKQELGIGFRRMSWRLC